MKFHKETQLYTASATDIKKAMAHVRKLNREACKNFYRCDFDMEKGIFLYRDYTEEYVFNDNIVNIV